MDDKNTSEFVNINNEEALSMLEILSAEGGRKDNSLGNLATRFAYMIQNSLNGVMRLNEVYTHYLCFII